MKDNIKVLVVDDEELIRLNFKCSLEDSGYQVVTASNGADALDLFRLEQPDIVLTDLKMPEMDGSTFISLACQINADTPLIVVSGAGSLSDAIDAIRKGAWDYLSKPIQQMEELDVVIKRNLQRSWLMVENRHYQQHLEKMVAERTCELNESRERYKRLLESVTSYVYSVVFQDGKCASTVHGIGCEAVTGYRPEDYALDQGLWYRMVHEDDRKAVLMMSERIMAKETAISFEHRIYHKDGSIRWVENTLVASRDLDGELLSYDGIIKDINERKQAEEALHKQAFILEQEISERQKAQEALETLNASLERRVEEELLKNREKDHVMIQQGRLAAMGELISNIAHQWRQPLNNLAVFLQSLQLDLQEGTIDQKTIDSCVTSCMETLQYMSKTISNFSNFFKPDRERTLFDCGTQIEKTLSLVSDSLKNTGISLHFINQQPGLISGYANSFSQALINIIDNAREALFLQQVQEPWVKISCWRDNDTVTISVSDNAGGIQDDLLDSLFDPYVTTKHKTQGTGLGLYIAKIIIERNIGGTLTVCNTPDGAEFQIKLPCVTTTEEPE